MNDSFKVLILWVAGLIGATGTSILIIGIISILPKPLLFQIIFGLIFILISALMVVMIRGK